MKTKTAKKVKNGRMDMAAGTIGTIGFILMMVEAETFKGQLVIAACGLATIGLGAVVGLYGDKIATMLGCLLHGLGSLAGKALMSGGHYLWSVSGNRKR